MLTWRVFAEPVTNSKLRINQSINQRNFPRNRKSLSNLEILLRNLGFRNLVQDFLSFHLGAEGAIQTIVNGDEERRRYHELEIYTTRLIA